MCGSDRYIWKSYKVRTSTSVKTHRPHKPEEKIGAHEEKPYTTCTPSNPALLGRLYASMLRDGSDVNWVSNSCLSPIDVAMWIEGIVCVAVDLEKPRPITIRRMIICGDTHYLPKMSVAWSLFLAKRKGRTVNMT